MGLDNHWICKPWNLARGLDTHVTRNLFHILRLPSTGPKIAQKYIANPVVYDRPEIGRVKFDVRYVVILKSANPLRVFAYRNFFLRFANKEFALNNFDVYEQHFTVMNYSEATPLCHVKCADFILEWEKQYPDFSWRELVEPKILDMFREVFEAAVARKPPKGIAESPQSRAVYAIDLMLEWKKEQMQPVLLEINFSPDCKRACEYYPNFYNDIFKCLFLDEDNPDVFHDRSFLQWELNIASIKIRWSKYTRAHYEYREAINDRSVVSLTARRIYLFKASEPRISHAIMSRSSSGKSACANVKGTLLRK